MQIVMSVPISENEVAKFKVNSSMQKKLCRNSFGTCFEASSEKHLGPDLKIAGEGLDTKCLTDCQACFLDALLCLRAGV